MPIDYKKYPSNWKTEIRPYVLNRSKHRCEFCKVKNYTQGYWEALANKIDLSMPESLEFFEFKLEQAIEIHRQHQQVSTETTPPLSKCIKKRTLFSTSSRWYWFGSSYTR